MAFHRFDSVHGVSFDWTHLSSIQMIMYAFRVYECRNMYSDLHFSKDVG